MYARLRVSGWGVRVADWLLGRHPAQHESIKSTQPLRASTSTAIELPAEVPFRDHQRYATFASTWQCHERW